MKLRKEYEEELKKGENLREQILSNYRSQLNEIDRNRLLSPSISPSTIRKIINDNKYSLELLGFLNNLLRIKMNLVSKQNVFKKRFGENI